jgi:Tfp pilus assembly protein PilE
MGFTLIELLGVIIVLGIILVISIASISKIVDVAAKEAFKSDAKMLLHQLEYEKLKDEDFDVTTLNINTLSAFNLSNINYKELKVGIINNKSYIIIVGKNRWLGLKACGTLIDMNIVSTNDTTTCKDSFIENNIIYNDIKGVNKPRLSLGMTPIKWDGTKWINTTEKDSEWYDYSIKKWANARTQDGSFWVWIPRYIYRISSNWHTSMLGTIDISFSVGTDDTNGEKIFITRVGNASDSNGKWTNHPAFTFGGVELTGFWVAKFEPTASEGVTSITDTCNQSDNDVTKTPKIIPNVNSWRCLTIGTSYAVSRNMENKGNPYGWNANEVDTHMMKDLEWGAVVYLSKSTYGKELEEVWLNPNSNYITGCAGDEKASSSATSCNQYHTSNGVKASTTGNIYGIYDMSGGAWERTVSYVDNGNASIALYGGNIKNADKKYKDLYTTTTDSQASNYNNSKNKKGNAMYETTSSYTGTTSWYDDHSDMLYLMYVWSARGGHYSHGVNSGIFGFSSTDGNAHIGSTFRPVVLVGEGL